MFLCTTIALWGKARCLGKTNDPAPGLRTLWQIGAGGLFHGFSHYAKVKLIQNWISLLPALCLSLTGRRLAKRTASLLRGTGRVASLWPLLRMEHRWVYQMAKADHEPEASALLQDVPRWVLCYRGAWWIYKGEKEDFLNSEEVPYFLPASSPASDRRGLIESWNATPKYLPRIISLFFMWPLPEHSWYITLQGLKSSVKLQTCGALFGVCVMLPLKFIYGRVTDRVRTGLLESGEAHLQKGLKHSRDHVDQARATIDDSAVHKEGKIPELSRQGTVAIKRDAAKNLQDKKIALARAIMEHRDKFQLEALTQRGLSLEVKRGKEGIAESLHKVARASSYVLLQGALSIQYVGEQGLDAGGLFRDYFQELSKYITTTSKLFYPGADAGLLPDKQPSEGKWQEELYSIGRLMAVAVIRQTPLEVAFSRCIFKVLMGESITAYDVRRIDVEGEFLRAHVKPLLEEGGLAALEDALGDKLTFTGVSFGASEESELIPGGESVEVTEENKRQYLTLLTEHYLLGRARRELAILVEGFHDILPKSILKRLGRPPTCMTALDLELLVTGMPEVDVKDWKAHTQGNLMQDNHKDIQQWFWEVVEALDMEQRAKLLAFVCGNARIPAEGFKSLRPPFTVRVGAAEVERLPTSHTCSNELDLPRYPSKEILQQRLSKVIALNEDAGFGFI
eukprot:g45357.t1